MKFFKVTFKAAFNPGIDEVWETVSEQKIDCLNWPEFPYRPEVNFKAVHHGELLFIRFDIKEKFPVRLACLNDQDPVYQDSCVEFFILDQEGTYHNFEFNAIGSCLSAKGKDRHQRTSRTSDEMSQIKRFPSAIKKSGDLHQWTLTVGIPFASMGVSRGGTYDVNFYKCGDLTEKKHYLSWNKIDTHTPDFHRPEYFGKMLLE